MDQTRADAVEAGGGLSPAPGGARPKIWTVGTLVYTLSGLMLLFFWLLWGDFALSMRDRSVGPLVEKFLLKHGASNTFKQILTSTLPTLIGLILGPAVSYLSDRTRSRRGRRIPFLLIPTPVAGLAMVGIAFCPQMGEWLYRATGHVAAAGIPTHQAASAYTLSVFAAFWLVFEVACIVSGAVFGGLINDVVPRAVLGRFSALFRAVSLFDGILFNALLFQHAQGHFTLMFALIGILFGGGFTLMCLKVREGQYPPPPADDDAYVAPSTGATFRLVAVVRRGLGAAAGYLRECFSQSYYLLVFAMGILSGLTFRPINDFTIRYAAQLGLPDGDYGFLVAISYVVSLILAFPLGMLVDRFHPLRMAMLAMGLYCLTALYGALLVHDAASFSLALVAHTVLSGTYFTCAASLGQQLMPRSKYSQYAAAGGLLGSIVSLVYGPAIGAILDATRSVTRVDGVEAVTFDYHLTFWGALIFSGLTLLTMALVHRRFVRYGGPRGYVAPSDEITTPAVSEPPACLVPIVLLCLGGAVLGIGAGYVLGFAVQPGAVGRAGVSLAGFHTLILANKDVRNLTTLCVAAGVVPLTILGGVVGARLSRRRPSAVQA